MVWIDKYDSDMIYHPFGRIDGPTSGPLQLRVEIQATLTWKHSGQVWMGYNRMFAHEYFKRWDIPGRSFDSYPTTSRRAEVGVTGPQVAQKNCQAGHQSINPSIHHQLRGHKVFGTGTGTSAAPSPAASPAPA